MSVDIDIVIVSIDSAHELSVVGHLYTTSLVDGTLLILDDPIVDSTIVDREDICWLARFGVNHCPDGATIAILVTVGTDNSKVTGGEIAHSTLDPRLDIELDVLLGHLGHLDGQARKHPRTMDTHEILHAETAG